MTVRDVAQRLNIKFDENQFSGHSLRKGGATSLALRMVPDHLIQVCESGNRVRVLSHS